MQEPNYSDGHGGNHIHTPSGQEEMPKNRIPIREEVLGKPHRRLKVITIGAGFSGKKKIPKETDKVRQSHSKQ